MNSLQFLYRYLAVSLAPQTGDINVMIVVAVILISAFMIFVLLKSRRPRD
ncbi:MAG: LPXTG cell wall anchor domain-containing protein [Clostridia bacterium]|nr:LPXTG cell wall anchor domain-containing protein [Clostridia bacterium]